MHLSVLEKPQIAVGSRMKNALFHCVKSPPAFPPNLQNGANWIFRLFLLYK